MGVPVVLLSTHGIWLLGAALLAGTVATSKRLTLWIPAIAVASHVVVLTALEPNRSSHGDQFEIILKTLIWPYFLLATWAGAAFGARLGTSGLFASSRVRILGAVCGCTLLAIVAWYARSVQAEMSADPAWESHAFMRTPLPRGYLASARYIREHANPRDVVQLSDNDDVLAFGALSERGTYFAYARINTGPMTTEDQRRLSEFKRMWFAADVARASEIAHTLGIEWLVISNQVRAPWEGTPAKRPVFASDDGYRIYRMP